MSRPQFDPFADEPTQHPNPKALEWIDARSLPAYAEDADGNVLFDHREHVTKPARSPHSVAALGFVAGMLLMTVAAVIAGLTR